MESDDDADAAATGETIHRSNAVFDSVEVVGEIEAHNTLIFFYLNSLLKMINTNV